MNIHPSSRLARTLSIWVKGRLYERSAIEWAAKQLQRAQGTVSSESIELFQFLEEEAKQDQSLSADHKTVWRLLSVAAQENIHAYRGRLGYELNERFSTGQFGFDDVSRLIDFVRPRLAAEPASSWRVVSEEVDQNPLRWVHWDFQSQSGSLFSKGPPLDRSDLEKLNASLLEDVAQKAFSALEIALQQAAGIGWINGAHNLPSTMVTSIVAPPSVKGLTGDDSEDSDPDAHEDGFAPIVRLTTAAFQCLLEKDVAAAWRCSSRWNEQGSGLVLRLAAFARWFPSVYSGVKVGLFLTRLSDAVFWDWSRYPEVATLRCLRWPDVPSDQRRELAQKLSVGPSNEALGISEEINEGIATYHRDHELARIVDQRKEVPSAFASIVNERRQRDPDFPRAIPTIEIGRHHVHFSRGKDGDAERFGGTDGSELLDQLSQSRGSRDFDQGDDANAFAATIEGRERLLRALQQALPGDIGFDCGWDLLLWYPPTKTDEWSNKDSYVESVAALSLALPAEKLGLVAERLCYWLDQADEVVPQFNNSETLWLALLPFAADQANLTGAHEGVHETDLTSDALNAPLGHLISFYLRRCPSMPAKGKKPPLPHGSNESSQSFKW